MEQKGIDFGGVANFPDEYSSKDGTLRLAIGCINENDSIEPLPHPAEEFVIINDGLALGPYNTTDKQLVRSARLIFIHRTSTYTHYILRYELVGFATDTTNKTITVDPSKYTTRIAWYLPSDVTDGTGDFAGHRVLDLGIVRADGTNSKGYNGTLDWNEYSDTDDSTGTQSKKWQADFVSNYLESNKTLNSRELSFVGEPAKNVAVSIDTDGFTSDETAAGAVARITVTAGQVPNVSGIRKCFNISTTKLKHNISADKDNTETGQYNGYNVSFATDKDGNYTDSRINTGGAFVFLITKDNIDIPEGTAAGETVTTNVIVTTEAWYDTASYNIDDYTYAPSGAAEKSIEISTTVSDDGTASSEVSDDTKSENDSGSTSGGNKGSDTGSGNTGTDSGDSGTSKTSFHLNNLLLTDFAYNDITAMGNMLIFATDSYMQYCLWKTEAYVLFTTADLRYDIRLRPTKDESFTSVQAFSAETFGSLVLLGKPAVINETDLNWGKESYDGTTSDDSSTDTDSIIQEIKDAASAGTRAQGIFAPDNNYYTSAEVKNIVAALDAYATTFIRNKADDYAYTFRHFNFGIAALRLYDGSHVALSDIFLLCPRAPLSQFRINTKGKAHRSKTRFWGSYYQVSAQVSGVSDVIKNVIQGVDIFFASPQTLIDTEDNLNIQDLHYFDSASDTDGFSTDATGNFINLTGQNAIELDATLHFRIATGDALQNIIDALSFRQTTFIPKEKFAVDGNASWQRVKPNNESQGEQLEIDDTLRGNIGARYAYTYSGRVNLAGVRRMENAALALRPTMYNYYERKITAGQTYTESVGPSWGKTLIDVNYTLGSGLIANSKSAEMIFTVNDRDDEGRENVKRYYSDNVEYPLNPFVSYPSRYATQFDIKIKVDGNYYGMTVTPVNSQTINLSYYLFVAPDRVATDNSLSLVPLQKVSVKDTTTYTTTTVNLVTAEDGFCALHRLSTMNDTLWQQEKAAAIGYVQDWQENKIFQSEADNPLYYPAKYTFTVGDGAIRGLVSNTTALSQGQFGAHPMYVFTTDGIWAVTAGSNGIWQAVQPTSRDVVLSDGRSITQTDSAIVYATTEGLMLLSGATTKDLSSALEGRDDSATFEGLASVLSSIGLPDITGPAEVRDYLDGAQCAFDARHARLWLYNDNNSYIYVLALNSGLWTMIPASWQYTVNNYPETLVGNDDGHVYNLSTENKSGAQVLLLTRPLKFSLPDIYKRLYEWALRGRFKSSASVVVYGSNDMLQWHPVSSAGVRLDSYSGTQYKYFALLAAANLSRAESLAGAVFKIDYSLTARLR